MTRYYEEDMTPHPLFTHLIAGVLGAVLMMVLSGVLRSNVLVTERRECTNCHTRQAEMIKYFQRAGSKNPEAMAVAVLKTRSPRLLAAMHVKGEKLSPHTSRAGGYKKKHQGAWQVNPDDWSAVPMTPDGQALQVQDILEELVQKQGIVTALNKYGGDTRGKYARTVLNEVKNVP